MIDMKLTNLQSPSDLMLGRAEVNEGPQYPHGLTISLTGEALKRLAIGEGNLPQVGAQMLLNAMVEVIGVSKSPNQIEDDRRVELQITALDLAAPEAANAQARDPATKLYG